MGEGNVTRLDAHAVSIDHAPVLQRIGYPPEARVASAVTTALPRLIRRVTELAEPLAVYTLFEVQQALPKGIQLSTGARFSGRRLAHAMGGARQAALFVLTLGEGVSTRTNELAAEDAFESFLFDTVASLLVERLADHFQTRLERQMNRRGAWGGLRFSPGYCDWPLADNHRLLRLVGGRRIGVQLTEGGMMAPQKTISGIIGFGPEPERIRVNPCTDCPRAGCDHRRH